MSEQVKAQAELLAEVVMDTIEAKGRIIRDDLVQALAGALAVEPAKSAEQSREITADDIRKTWEASWRKRVREDGLMAIGGAGLIRAACGCMHSTAPGAVNPIMACDACARLISAREKASAEVEQPSATAVMWRDPLSDVDYADDRGTRWYRPRIAGPTGKWTKVEK